MQLIVRHSYHVLRKRAEKGFTLLEYCAGAAVLLVLVWGAMHAMGLAMANYFSGIRGWLENNTYKP